MKESVFVEFNGENDYGIYFQGQCPDCGDRFKCAELGDDPACECGLEWSLTLRITGSK